MTRHLSSDSDKLTGSEKSVKRFHWWGNVRLASYPQTINAPVGEFVSNLGTSVTDVKVNELVQSAEFRTGLDVRIPGVGNKDDAANRLSIFAGFGGVGPVDPKQGVSVFKIPMLEAGTSTTARNQFLEQYPERSYPGITKATYVAFTSPDRGRFYRQYAPGLRYTQLYDLTEEDAVESEKVWVPASVAASFGQHELVSGGHLRGIAGNFEAIFPFKLGAARAYVFGRAVMSFSKNQDRRPVFLDPAIQDNKPVPPSAPGVYVISTPSNRDVYTMGIGIDAVEILKTLLGKKPPATPPANYHPVQEMTYG